MIGEPAPNTITRPYRGLSVQEADIPLTQAAIEGLLRGREIYRRTAYLALRNGDGAALAAVRPERTDTLFSPVAEVRMLSGAETTLWVTDPGADVGNATALAQAAAKHHRDGVLAYLVQGKFEHVNFIWRPSPVPVRVTEVIPPNPPKLLAMAEQVVAFDEDLPPVQLELDAVSVDRLMDSNPAPAYLLPCRGSGAATAGTADMANVADTAGAAGAPGAEVSFLDTHPAYRPDWLLIGCERSVQFHEHFYRSRPDQVDLCPRARTAGSSAELLLTKCCLLERGIEVDGRTAVVPWGANLDEVRAALRALCGLPPPGQAAPHQAAPHQAAPHQAAPHQAAAPSLERS